MENDEHLSQWIFDANLHRFLDMLLVTFVFLFSKCLLVVSSGNTVLYYLLFVIEFILRVSEATSLRKESGPTHHLDLLVKLLNPL